MGIRLLVADDSPLARSAIGSMLAGHADFEIVGEACDGQEAVQLVRQLQPEMVLMDINMPRCDGLLATRLIKRVAPQTVVVILTVSDDARDLFEAIRSGAQGYLLKSLDPADWITYLRGFAQGHWSVPKEMAHKILAEMAPLEPPPASVDVRLTDREVEVLRLVARAMTNAEIAETLAISNETVKNHLKNIIRKLHLKNRVELAVYAKRMGLDTGSGT
jgi:two-component system nitrate/nitrite response regulator NarL